MKKDMLNMFIDAYCLWNLNNWEDDYLPKTEYLLSESLKLDNVFNFKRNIHELPCV